MGDVALSIGNIKPPFPVTPPPAPPPPGYPSRHRMPPSPRAGRQAVCPAGSPQAAGRLPCRSSLGLGDQPQPAARSSETRPAWARGWDAALGTGHRVQYLSPPVHQGMTTQDIIWYPKNRCSVASYSASQDFQAFLPSASGACPLEHLSTTRLRTRLPWTRPSGVTAFDQQRLIPLLHRGRLPCKVRLNILSPAWRARPAAPCRHS